MPFVDMKVDVETATQIADFFVEQERFDAASSLLGACIQLSPHDKSLRQRAVEVKFDAEQRRYPLGSVERSRFLLGLMYRGDGVARVERAYFQNLQHMAVAWTRRQTPGTLLLGIGPGRCGSTSLAALLGQTPEFCITHENPPLLDWKPSAEQLRFQLRRFQYLLRFFSVVGDIAHWWLPALPHVRRYFPQLKVVALARDAEDCVGSFERVLGSGDGSTNHWHDHGGRLWQGHRWDTTFPTYPLDGSLSAGDLDRSRHVALERYVQEYYQAVEQWRERLDERMLTLRTEALGEPTTSRSLSGFLGGPVTEPAAGAWLNRGHTAHSGTSEYWF